MTLITQDTTPPHAPELSEAELAELQAILKRCSPETLEAAFAFRRTRNGEHLATLIRGVIGRYVERELRPKLKTQDDTLRLVEDLGLDSLSLMEIVVMAEDVLKISVSNEELMKLRTVGDVRQFIATKVGAGT